MCYLKANETTFVVVVVVHFANKFLRIRCVFMEHTKCKKKKKIKNRIENVWKSEQISGILMITIWITSTFVVGFRQNVSIIIGIGRLHIFMIYSYVKCGCLTNPFTNALWEQKMFFSLKPRKPIDFFFFFLVFGLAQLCKWF